MRLIIKGRKVDKSVTTLVGLYRLERYILRNKGTGESDEYLEMLLIMFRTEMLSS